MNRLMTTTAAFGAVRQGARVAATVNALRGALFVALFSACLFDPTPAAAQAPISPLFREADLPLGVKLIAEHQCAACHVRRVGGDGSAIYRPKGKVNTPGLLRGMVDYCSTELNLGLFPEEVTAVAAVLDRDHYRFAAAASAPHPAPAPAAPPPPKR